MTKELEFKVPVRQRQLFLDDDATDPAPARRYKGAIPNVGFIVSPDGLNWKLLDVPGVPSSDEYNFSFDEQEHLFILTVKHGGPIRRRVNSALKCWIGKGKCLPYRIL